MPRRDPRLALTHMLEHAREAAALAEGKTRSDLAADRTLSLALVRLLEIVGEAATRVPHDIRKLDATVPWADIVGMRNRLIHGYDAVDLDVVWRIVSQDLTPLIAALDRLLGSGGVQGS